METKDYSVLSKIYDPLIGPFLRNIRETITTLAELKDKKFILEIAFGTGSQIKSFLSSGSMVYGVDLSESMFRLANKKLGTCSNLKLFNDDASSLKFNNETFDIVTTTLSLHEMDPRVNFKVINEMKRVTKKDGRLIIADYVHHDNSFRSKFCYVLIRIAERLAGRKHYSNYKIFMAKGGLENFLKSNNLRVEKEVDLFCHNIGVFRVKR